LSPFLNAFKADYLYYGIFHGELFLSAFSFLLLACRFTKLFILELPSPSLLAQTRAKDFAIGKKFIIDETRYIVSI
jgi:hypothetical protein